MEEFRNSYSKIAKKLSKFTRKISKLLSKHKKIRSTEDKKWNCRRNTTFNEYRILVRTLLTNRRLSVSDNKEKIYVDSNINLNENTFERDKNKLNYEYVLLERKIFIGYQL